MITVKCLTVILDHKLTWQNYVQHVVKKLCIAKRILCKHSHYALLTILKSVYYSIVYPHLQHAVTSWRNISAKYLTKIEVQQNLLVKIMTHAPFLRIKVVPFSLRLDIPTINNMFKLEVLKFVFNFRTKSILQLLFSTTCSNTQLSN